MKTTILFFMTFFLLASCTKDSTNNINAQLPAQTQTGANTAGCIIDGKVLVPKNGSQAIGGPTNYGLTKTQGINFWPNKNDYWQLEIANKKDYLNYSIYLWIKNMATGNGDYVVGQSYGWLFSSGPNNNQMIAEIETNGVLKTYYSSSNSGMIKITRSDLAPSISIHSGTFNCTLYNKDNPSETIQVTDGRFDINGITLNN